MCYKYFLVIEWEIKDYRLICTRYYLLIRKILPEKSYNLIALIYQQIIFIIKEIITLALLYPDIKVISCS